jgi:hypothetical protein
MQNPTVRNFRNSFGSPTEFAGVFVSFEELDLIVGSKWYEVSRVVDGFFI